MSAVARSHGRSPWREAFELSMLRPSRAGGTESLTTKENAKGEALIEALTTYRDEGEDRWEWIDRHCAMHVTIRDRLRPFALGNGED